MDIANLINVVTEHLPTVGLVSAGVIASIVAILRAVAKKKGPENTKADEVADGLETAGRYVEDLTDGHPDIDPTNNK